MRDSWIATGFVESIVNSPQVAVTGAEPYVPACVPIRNAFPLQLLGGLSILTVRSPRLCGGCRVERPLVLLHSTRLHDVAVTIVWRLGRDTVGSTSRLVFLAELSA